MAKLLSSLSAGKLDKRIAGRMSGVFMDVSDGGVRMLLGSMTELGTDLGKLDTVV